jgi:glutathionyl-hydroquinone reductase
MGQLVDGQWQDKDLPRSNRLGEFVRTNATFREMLGSQAYPAAPQRYHLFVNAGCPWAYRTILYRSIKKLDALVSLTFTQPAAGPQGWTFGEQPEPLLNTQHIHEVYTTADPRFTGRCTVPVLWDKQTRTIVNNESADIIRMFNTVFNKFPGVAPTDYYPAQLRDEIDSLNEEIYEHINNGVYRCGFAQSQHAYEEAYDKLFTCLDRLDDRLSQQRYLCGAAITEADWRLFATLVRFDLAYHGQFRCNRNQLKEFTHLWPYCRDLYQTPGVAETVDVAAIKGIYYGSRAPGILPKGPMIDFAEPHGRA